MHLADTAHNSAIYYYYLGLESWRSVYYPREAGRLSRCILWCGIGVQPMSQAVYIAMAAVINRTALSVIRFLIKHATASSLRPSIVYCAPPVGGIRQCCDLSVGLSVCRPTTCTGWAKKRGHRHMTIILSILKTDLRFFFHWKIPF